jgi:exonuclease III
LSKEHKENIFCLQEIHISEGVHPNRLKLQEFQLVCHDDHPKHETAIYILEDVSSYTIIPPTKINDTLAIGVTVSGISIYKSYTPPNTSWVHGSFPTVSKLSVILGDFNSHNTCGYATKDEVGDALEEGIGSQDLYLIQGLNTF